MSRPVHAHSSRTRSPARRQAGRAVWAVVLAAAIFGLLTGYRTCKKKDLGKKLTFGKGEVYYKDGATRKEVADPGCVVHKPNLVLAYFNHAHLGHVDVTHYPFRRLQDLMTIQVAEDHQLCD